MIYVKVWIKEYFDLILVDDEIVDSVYERDDKKNGYTFILVNDGTDLNFLPVVGVLCYVMGPVVV